MADRIRKINLGTRDTVHKVILSGLGASSLRSIDVAPDGTIYGVDTARHVVYKIFEDGRLLGVLDGDVGTSDQVQSRGMEGSDGLDARLTSPLGLCCDRSGNIWIGDKTSQKIKRISPSGRCIDFAGATSNGDAVGNAGTDARFGSGGMGLCVDKAGVLYVADTGNHKIKKLWSSGKSTVLAGGPGGSGSSGLVNANGNTARFASPQDVTCDNQGNLYVADTGNNRIRKVTEMGDVVTLAGALSGALVDGLGNNARFTSPRRVVMDWGNQFLYVLDHGNSAIRRVDMTGNVTTFCSYNPTDSGTGDIAIDASGFLYVLERA